MVSTGDFSKGPCHCISHRPQSVATLDEESDTRKTLSGLIAPAVLKTVIRAESVLRLIIVGELISG